MNLTTDVPYIMTLAGRGLMNRGLDRRGLLA